MKYSLILGCVISVCCFAGCIHVAIALPKHLDAPTQDWVLLGKPPKGHEVEITFAVKQHNPGWLEDKLKAVSYPDSPEYTNYMNFDEIANHVYGEPESVIAVVKTLDSMGVDESKIKFTLGQDFVVATVPHEAAETHFSAEFFEFKHKQQDSVKIVTSLAYTIPSLLKEHVDFISGICLFPASSSKTIMRPYNPHSEEARVTPSYIDSQYNISGYTASNNHTSQAVAAFLKQYFDESDLKKFQTTFDIPVKPIAKIVGKDKPTDPGIEANLDVQYIGATGRNVDTWFISISTYSNGGQEDFLSWMVQQVNTTDSPWVHSVSYGDDESSIASDYIQRVDNEFMKFGVSGRTVLFASGDSGVGCTGALKFTPNWPTSSPYITSVGGTTSLTTVWSAGGGGFSNVFPTPDYQKDVVDSYLKSGKAPRTSYFNVSGRAYPDVSAFSTNFIIIEYGEETPVAGTSCSTPTFAGVVSILNDIRLNKGQKTLGFLNPLLYTTLKGNGFFDIIYGDNGNDVCKGFEAAKGWDPASGWGSPNFGLLKDLVV